HRARAEPRPAWGAARGGRRADPAPAEASVSPNTVRNCSFTRARGYLSGNRERAGLAVALSHGGHNSTGTGERLVSLRGRAAADLAAAPEPQPARARAERGRVGAARELRGNRTGSTEPRYVASPRRATRRALA